MVPKLERSRHNQPMSAKEILDNLESHNAFHVPVTGKDYVTLTVREDSGLLVAGLHGYLWWDWLYINYLWVRESHRGQGLGKNLVSMAESEAQNMHCVGSHLETFDFQAKGFYKNIGYELFGSINNFPSGHQRFFFKKHFA